MEVLISMFVLLVGLMGVAAMIPAGRFEILQGAKIDHATAIGRAAFRDLKVRGYLKPGPREVGKANWIAAGGANAWSYVPPPPEPVPPPFIDPRTNTRFQSMGVVIDPLGCAAGYGSTFPSVSPALATTAPSLLRIYPLSASTPALADSVFRNADDLILNPNATDKNLPPHQLMVETGGVAIKRQSQGDYSWMATIVPDGAAGDNNGDGIADGIYADVNGDGMADDLNMDGNPDPPLANDAALTGRVTVSVVVFHKRDLSSAGAGEATATVNSMLGAGIGGGEVAIDTSTIITKFPKGAKPGTWVMLAGKLTHTNPSGASVPPQADRKYFRWYKVVAADTIASGAQNVTLAGPDWNTNMTETQLWLFDNVVAVYEKNMRLEIE